MPPVTSFKIIICMSDFLQSKYDMPSLNLGARVLSAWCSLNFLDLWFEIWHLFWGITSHYCFKYLFCSFFFYFLYSHYAYVTLLSLSHSPWVGFSCFFLSAFFLLTFLEVSIDTSSSLEIFFPQLCPGY